MTTATSYFPASTEPTKVRVAKYREELGFAEYMVRKVNAPGCRWDEVIKERRNNLFTLFRAMRDLQAIKCSRRSDDDKARYAAVLIKATEAVNKFGPDYFYDHTVLSTATTDEQLEDNWAGSRMADSLTYLMSPTAYPRQFMAVCAELQGLPKPEFDDLMAKLTAKPQGASRVTPTGVTLQAC